MMTVGNDVTHLSHVSLRVAGASDIVPIVPQHTAGLQEQSNTVNLINASQTAKSFCVDKERGCFEIAEEKYI